MISRVQVIDIGAGRNKSGVQEPRTPIEARAKLPTCHALGALEDLACVASDVRNTTGYNCRLGCSKCVDKQLLCACSCEQLNDLYGEHKLWQVRHSLHRWSVENFETGSRMPRATAGERSKQAPAWTWLPLLLGPGTRQCPHACAGIERCVSRISKQ